jgi:hypothetical protein
MYIRSIIISEYGGNIVRASYLLVVVTVKYVLQTQPCPTPSRDVRPQYLNWYFLGQLGIEFLLLLQDFIRPDVGLFWSHFSVRTNNVNSHISPSPVQQMNYLCPGHVRPTGLVRRHLKCCGCSWRQLHARWPPCVPLSMISPPSRQPVLVWRSMWPPLVR